MYTVIQYTYLKNRLFVTLIILAIDVHVSVWLCLLMCISVVNEPSRETEFCCTVGQDVVSIITVSLSRRREGSQDVSR